MEMRKRLCLVIAAVLLTLGAATGMAEEEIATYLNLDGLGLNYKTAKETLARYPNLEKVDMFDIPVRKTQVRELDELLQQKGFGKKAITIAKGELEEEGEILRWKIYEGSRPVWFVKCTEEDFSPETPCTEGAEQVEQAEQVE